MLAGFKRNLYPANRKFGNGTAHLLIPASNPIRPDFTLGIILAPGKRHVAIKSEAVVKSAQIKKVASNCCSSRPAFHLNNRLLRQSWQIALWVDGFVVKSDLVMKMRACRSARRSNITNVLSLADLLTDCHPDFGKMSVTGR